MLPMCIALTKTNAAGLMADQLIFAVGTYGPMVIAAVVFIVTAVLTQALNGAVVAAIMGPIAIRIAQLENINPRGLVMCVALAASMAFITPLGHPVNILVMGPGGYKFRDFIRIGLPLTVLLFFVAMIFLRIFWGV
jgi:di/tricarboxylate transporter